jgi:hypothetical protein
LVVFGVCEALGGGRFVVLLDGGPAACWPLACRRADRGAAQPLRGVGLGRQVVAVESGGGVDDPPGSAPQGLAGSTTQRMWTRTSWSVYRPLTDDGDQQTPRDSTKPARLGRLWSSSGSESRPQMTPPATRARRSRTPGRRGLGFVRWGGGRRWAVSLCYDQRQGWLPSILGRISPRMSPSRGRVPNGEILQG